MQKIQSTAQKGFTLIELMIVVAIIGILAAVAIPQYTLFITRADVNGNVTGALRIIQADITEYAQHRDSLPADLTALTDFNNKTYPTSIDWVASALPGANGVTTLTFDTTANIPDIPANVSGTTVIVTPTYAGNGVTTWAVTGGTMPAEIRPRL